MNDWIAWLISGVTTAGLVAIWFASAHKKLSHAKKNIENAIRQVRLHENGFAQVQNGPYKAAAVHSLNISRSLYREAVKNYELVRHKPGNRLPAFVLGYRAMPDNYDEQ